MNVVILFIDTALVFSAVGDVVPQALAMLGTIQRIQRQVQTYELPNTQSEPARSDRLHVFLLESPASDSTIDTNSSNNKPSQGQLKNGLHDLNHIIKPELQLLTSAVNDSATGDSVNSLQTLARKNVTVVTISANESFEHAVSLKEFISVDLHDSVQNWVIGDAVTGFEALADVEMRVKDLLTEPIARKLAPSQRKGCLLWLSQAPSNDTLLSFVYQDSSVEWILLPDHNAPSSTEELTASGGALVYTEMSESRDRLLELPNSKKLISRIKKNEVLIGSKQQQDRAETQLLITDQYIVRRKQNTTVGQAEFVWDQYVFGIFEQ